MKINELQRMIKKGRPNGDYNHKIGGCELLEHIEDIPGFVLLLRKFRKHDGTAYDSFTDHYPDVIKSILDGDVIFGIDLACGWWIYVHVNDNYFGVMYGNQ